MSLKPLQASDLNRRTNLAIVQTPVKPVSDKPAKKKKEKLSALCKTPPSIIRTRGGRGYHRGLFLGEGGFARCFQMKDESGEIFAAKTVAKASIKNEKTKTKLLSEIKIHKSMSHINIVGFIDCFEDDTNVYILLEICPNGSLMDLLKTRKTLTEPEVRFFMVQIIGAIRYLHSRRVIHRDLKLGNIFFDPEMNLKIGDFGLASVLGPHSSRKYTICGTPNYIAPEVLEGKNTGHSFEIDIWAIGVMMYALLCGKPPFQSKDVQVIYERIKQNDYHFPNDDKVQISNEAKKLISDILATNPLQRPSLEDILEYPWFKSGSFPKKITVESLRHNPDFSNITKEQSIINFKTAKLKAGINDNKQTPVELLKQQELNETNREKVLPSSLSPKNTRNKYKEISRRDSKESSYAAINNLLLIIDKIENNQFVQTDIQSPITVTKWVDYSNKHGFAFELSTKDIGVLFNNGDSILNIDNNSNEIYYIKDDTARKYPTNGIPYPLKRNVEILHFFENYMQANLSSAGDGKGISNEVVYMKFYVRNDVYVLFHLSNETFQWNFKDHHKYVLKGSTITHISADKQVTTLSLKNALNGEVTDDYFPLKFEIIKKSLRKCLQ
ncbi:hypothetical protein PACTADRAFT_50313 [Pachysolen tannophilus NRRL Y-2460]|uniref:Serine/threonine-protein kinase n=1 Tax=Pachysolen tannophilus NRRL Y-2460 TaxID=669874 RepID=A0A1E4TV62_PACTA|nr:hypothetical protein PACTADRAFT_50313 [Pachysolen tannophilus NRRL Y-2460]